MKNTEIVIKIKNLIGEIQAANELGNLKGAIDLTLQVFRLVNKHEIEIPKEATKILYIMTGKGSFAKIINNPNALSIVPSFESKCALEIQKLERILISVTLAYCENGVESQIEKFVSIMSKHCFD